MHSRKRTLLLVNPGAGRGEETLAPVIDRFRRSGLQVTLESFEALPALRQDIDRLRSTHDQLVICGGDGSISSAAGAVMESGLPMGILPMGTANDLARTLGMPLDLPAAAEAIAGGRVRCIDLGRVNGRYFFNAASIGLGVHVTQLLTYELKQRWGVLAYPRALLEALATVRPFTARIDCDGTLHLLRSIQITVGNGRFYGGGMAVAAEAAIDDQRLDLYSVRPSSLWRFLIVAAAMKLGRHGRRPEVALLRGRRIAVETSRARLVTADGEVVSRTPALFEVVPAALPVLVPEDASQAEGLRRAAQ